MGRPRKSLEQHLAAGTYKACVHGPLDPNRFNVLPKLSAEAPDCLDSYSRTVWDRHYKKLSDAGILTEGEYETFVSYCLAFGMVERAAMEMKRTGGVMKPKKKGGKRGSAQFELTVSDETMQVNPWYRIMRDAMHDVARFAPLLGLTATDRARVVRAKDAGSKDLPNTKPKTKLDLAS